MFLFWYLLAELRKEKTEATKQSGDIQESKILFLPAITIP